MESVLDGTFTTSNVAVAHGNEAGAQDLVLFNVKMYQNAQAIEATRPMLGPNTVVLTLQNGIDNGDQLAAACGAD